MTSLIPAYIEQTDTHHVICNNHPESEFAKRLAYCAEQKKELDSIKNFAEYVKKEILLKLCDNCIEEIENNARM